MEHQELLAQAVQAVQVVHQEQAAQVVHLEHLGKVVEQNIISQQQ
jgi:hypothetical protein